MSARTDALLSRAETGKNSTASIISVMAGCHPACACVNVRRLQNLLEGRPGGVPAAWRIALLVALSDFRCALKGRLKSAELLPFFPVLTSANSTGMDGPCVDYFWEWRSQCQSPFFLQQQRCLWLIQ